RDPRNSHALANLPRYFILSGRLAEASPWIERLRALDSDVTDMWVKKAETFSVLGDDQGVLDAFRAAQQSGRQENGLQAALLYHLAAAAFFRLGREADARRYWKKALAEFPALGPARDNLDDLDLPVGERDAPWPFAFSHWVPHRTVVGLLNRFTLPARRGRDEALTREARGFLSDHPELVSVVPMLLDRGDPVGRGFALRLALLAETPEMLAALRDFALEQRGPD